MPLFSTDQLLVDRLEQMLLPGVNRAMEDFTIPSTPQNYAFDAINPQQFTLIAGTVPCGSTLGYASCSGAKKVKVVFIK